MKVLYSSDVATVTQEQGFVRARRTSLPIVAREGAVVDLDEVQLRFRIAVPMRERKGQGLLLDMRDAPIAMNDESQEHLRPLVTDMVQGFDRVALLLKTAVGLLQAARRTREELAFGRRTMPVFNDEFAAIAYLRGEEPAIPSARPSRRG